MNTISPIWAPWRMEYILGEKQMDCFICEALANGVGKETLLLHVSSHSLVMMNRYPYISGHLMVVPQTHVSSLASLSREQMDDLHELLRTTVGLVKEVLNPDGINIGMNLGEAAGAGLRDHIHWHVVPRFSGDNNVFNVLAGERVIPECLEDTFQRYLPAFEKLP